METVSQRPAWRATVLSGNSIVTQWTSVMFVKCYIEKIRSTFQQLKNASPKSSDLTQTPPQYDHLNV